MVGAQAVHQTYSRQQSHPDCPVKERYGFCRGCLESAWIGSRLLTPYCVLAVGGLWLFLVFLMLSQDFRHGRAGQKCWLHGRLRVGGGDPGHPRHLHQAPGQDPALYPNH